MRSHAPQESNRSTARSSTNTRSPRLSRAVAAVSGSDSPTQAPAFVPTKASAKILKMIERTAFNQLKHSTLLLIGTIVGMLFAEQKILPHRIEPIKYSGELGQPNLQARSPSKSLPVFCLVSRIPRQNC